MVHNRYRSAWPSGEDLVFDAEVALLRERGHEVQTFERASDDIRGALGTAAAALSTVWNARAARDLAERVESFAPGLVHFHNTFPLISGAAVRAAGRRAAVVATLHNYRLVCAAGTLFRDGAPCEDCLRGGPLPWLPAITHGCYRDSRVATAPLVTAGALHTALGTWARYVDRFVALTAFARDRLVAGGLPGERMTVRGHFLADPPEPADTHDGPVVFLGRLDAAKGVDLLFDAWRELPDVPLLLVGDGPLRARLEASEVGRRSNVTFAGLRPHDECLAYLRDARFLVFPSIVYETFGLALRDAMAMGKPIVATSRGSAAELVRDGVTGRHFRAGHADDLARVAREVARDDQLRERLGLAARREFEMRFTADASYEALRAIYAEALASARRRGVAR